MEKYIDNFKEEITMISKVYSSKILNTLLGVTETASYLLSAPAKVYIGLCASEPAAEDGSLTNAGEPTSVASYARKEVCGTSGTKYFGLSSSSGVIENSSEIQFKTAREDYPEKINYWFLSASSTGAAFLWGKIKDVLLDTRTVEGFLAESTYNTYSATTTTDTLLGLQEGQTYIVSWDGKEYEETAYLYESGDASYIRLGNPMVSGGTRDEDKPFGILYNEQTSGVETVGHMTMYSLTGEGTHDVAIYALGIEVRKATVPTFYENELQASIDV